MMKHQDHNIPMKVIQRKEKQTKRPNFMPQVLPDDENREGINSLNSKQR